MKSNAHFSGSECTPEHLCRFKQFIVQDSSTPRGIWQLKSPYPREFAIQGKKMPMPGGQPGGRGGGGLGAGGIDWCISISLVTKTEGSYNEFINSWHSWHPEGNKIKERGRINQKNEFTEKIKVKGSCNSDKNSTFISFQHKSLQTPFLEVNHEITNIKSS